MFLTLGKISAGAGGRSCSFVRGLWDAMENDQRSGLCKSRVLDGSGMEGMSIDTEAEGSIRGNRDIYTSRGRKVDILITAALSSLKSASQTNFFAIAFSPSK